MPGIPTAVYVDGFNFYYGAARPHGIRWIDLRRMSQRILGPRHAVEQVYLYTAPLHDRVSDGRAAWRHELFLRALAARGGVEIVLGSHVVGARRVPLLRPDGGAGDLVTVLQTTEKGTDVNLAVDLVHHALTNRWSAAAVVSNGGDLGVMLSNWGLASSSGVGDISHDGVVDGVDLAELLARWGTCQ